VTTYAGGSWGSKDTIVFAMGVQGLWKLPASGGEPVQFTGLDTTRGMVAHRTPSFLPDGETVLFTDVAHLGGQRVAVASLDGRTTVLDGARGVNPHYIDGNRILFTNANGTVFVASFDPSSRTLSGTPLAVLENADARSSGRVALDVSRSGTLAWVRGRAESVLAFVGPRGEEGVIAMSPRRMRHPRLSPDGTRIAVEVVGNTPSGATSNIWVYDIGAGTFTRITFDDRGTDPIWSPDGRRIAFSRPPNGPGQGVDSYWTAADGSGTPELLVGGPGSQWASAFTPDGKAIIFDELLTGVDMRVRELSIGTTESRTLVASQFGARLAAISPDGKWIAYVTSETGNTEVFVRPYGGGPGKWQISVNGASEPTWSRDGRTIYYRGGGRIIAAELEFLPSLRVKARQALADDRFISDNGANMDVTRDGRVLLLKPAESVTDLNIVVNWLTEITRRFETQKQSATSRP
jgi:eukaryotic-like serine/threonine-protein kinase